MAVELTDQQYEAFQKAMGFLTEVSTNPATRRDFERVAKKIRPEIETTDDIAAEAAKPYIDKLDATNEKIDAFLTAQQEREERAAQEASDRLRDDAFGRLKAEGYTEDGLEKIKGIMVSRSIADPEAAAALFDRMNPKPMEAVGGSWEPDHWDIQANAVDRDVEGLFANPDKWADREVYNVLNEMRGAK
jgi:hypothetical protein